MKRYPFSRTERLKAALASPGRPSFLFSISRTYQKYQDEWTESGQRSKHQYILTFHLNLSSIMLFWASVSFPRYLQMSSPIEEKILLKNAQICIFNRPMDIHNTKLYISTIPLNTSKVTCYFMESKHTKNLVTSSQSI